MRRLEEENKNLTKCNLNLQEWLDNKEKVNKSLREENEKLKKYYDRDKEELMESCYSLAKENDKLKSDLMEDMKEITKLEKENKNLKERIDVLYEFIERNDKLVDEVIDEEDLDKLNRYIYIDDDLVDRTLESED
jgi:chromosome segregation ATPase